ncbi:MAG: FtsW/RodA/SpoVE family cell cycle protein [Minisyncoccia bacterium]
MKKSDRILYFALFVLIAFGLMILGSLSKNDSPRFFSLEKQLFFVFLGLIIFFVFSAIDWHIFATSRSLLITLYFISVLSLALVLVIGKTSRGSTGWFNFGFFSFQPVEIAKIILILILAKYLSSRHKEIWQFQYLFASGFYALLPIGLVILQPDLGGAIVLALIWFALVLVSGIRWSQIFLLLMIFLLVVGVAWSFLLKPYQRDRILNFVNPQKDILGIGYNRHQALIAIGSGRFLGKGLGWGTQTQLNFLPLATTDFIFAALAEELGFLGIIILLTAFLVLFFRLSYWINIFDNNFCKLFTFGFAFKLLIELFINIGMNTGLLPIIGLALPFLSYGGSHLLTDFFGLGIINSMIRHRT